MDTTLAKTFQSGGSVLGPLAALAALAVAFFFFPRFNGKHPPTLREIIPFYNAYQYLTDIGGFMDRVM